MEQKIPPRVKPVGRPYAPKTESVAINKENAK